nr:accessory gene regulator B family protein [Paenibacillus sp. ACRRX]
MAKYLINNGSNVSNEILCYAISNILNIVLVSVVSLTIGFITGTLIETLIALVAFAAIKHYSGGVHMASMDRCFVLSTIIITVPPHVVMTNKIVLIITLVSIVAYTLYAPNYTEQLVRPFNKRRNRLISIVIVGANLYLQSSTLALIYFVQGLMIVPYSRKGETKP